MASVVGVELSRILFAGSDTLLLDEPTNHLDLDAKNWLLRFLRSYRGPPRDQPRPRTAGRGDHSCAHLDRSGEDAIGHIVEYKGTYSQYLTARAADEVRLAKKAAQQAKEINRLQSVVDRFGAKASKAAMHTASRSASGGSRTSGSTHRSTPRR